MAHRARYVLKTTAILAIIATRAAGSGAQELTPRAYWPAPAGTKVAVAGYVYASGDVLFDPSIPLYGVKSRVRVGVLAYMQTFSLWGRTANLVVEQPFSSGTAHGYLGDIPAQGSYSGIGDLGATLSVNLLGAPAMTPADFMALRSTPRPILGASLKLKAPTGSYDQERLLNVGENRWAGKAELGIILPLKPRFLLEIDAGVWRFGDNDEFISGVKQQAAVYAAQVHLVRRFQPGFWASLDLNYFTGGRQTINGNRLGDVQQNSKIGGTMVVPFRKRHAIKLVYATGIFTEYGTDFDQFMVSYQVLLNRR